MNVYKNVIILLSLTSFILPAYLYAQDATNFFTRHLRDICGGEALNEGFEQGEIPYNWTVYDNDGSGETWQITAGYAHSGSYAVWTLNALNAGGDDWLITPKLVVAEGDSVIFWAKSYFIAYLDDFDVLVSTTDTAVQSFGAKLDTVKEAPYEWTRYAYSLGPFVGEEIYVAIRVVTGYGLFVDDVTGAEVWAPPYPVVYLWPDSWKFTGVSPNVTVSKTVKITNRGGVDLEIADVITDNPIFDAYVSSETVVPCSSETITVTFTPDSAVHYSDNLIVTSNAPTSPDSVKLSGYAVDLESFFPMHIGNVWEYTLDFTDTYQVRVTGDTLMPNGETYRIFEKGGDSPDIYFYYYRIDDSLRVWRYFGFPDSCDREDIVVDLSLPDSTAWQECYIETPETDFPALFETFEWGYSALAVVASTKRFYGISVDPITNDTLWGSVFYDKSWLAEGIGVTFSQAELAPTERIRGAIIDGVQYGYVMSIKGSAELSSFPEKLSLYQNYPNPFNASTTINFQINEGGNVELTIFNTLGDEIKTLFSGYKAPGRYSLVWHGKNDNGFQLSSGIYFCTIANNSSFYSIKILMIK